MQVKGHDTPERASFNLHLFPHLILPSLASATAPAAASTSALAWRLRRRILPLFRAASLPGTNGVTELLGKGHIITGDNFMNIRATIVLIRTETVTGGTGLKVDAKPLRHLRQSVAPSSFGR